MVHVSVFYYIGIIRCIQWARIMERLNLLNKINMKLSLADKKTYQKWNSNISLVLHILRNEHILCNELNLDLPF